MRGNRWKSRRGAAAAVAAICLPMLLGVMALAIDGGLLRAEGQRSQVAADAASYAAIRAYHKAGSGQGDPMTAATATAVDYARVGYPANNPPQVTVVRLASPPPRYPTADLALKVVVSTHPPRLFSGIFGGPAPSVASASVSVRLRPSGGGIIVLNPTAANSLTVVGSGVIGDPDPSKPRPGILVKSNSTTAGYFYGDSRTYAASIGIVGKYVLDGSATVNGKTTSPDVIRTGVDPSTIIDPLASTFSPPDVSGLPLRQFSSAWKDTSASNPLQLLPGRYNGDVQFGGSMYYSMAPGTYYISGGKFNPSGGAHVKADGATIYLDTGDFVVDGGSDFTASGSMAYLGKGNFTLTGGASSNVTAPGDGPYEGVVLVQPPTPGADRRQVQINGGTTTNIAGTIYAPTAAMALSGGSYTINGRTQLIVDTLSVSGAAVIRPDTQTAGTGIAFHLAQ